MELLHGMGGVVGGVGGEGAKKEEEKESIKSPEFFGRKESEGGGEKEEEKESLTEGGVEGRTIGGGGEEPKEGGRERVIKGGGKEEGKEEGKKEEGKEGPKERSKKGSRNDRTPLVRSASPCFFTSQPISSPLPSPPSPPSPRYFVGRGGRRKGEEGGEGWGNGEFGAREVPLCMVGRAYDTVMSFDLRNSLVFFFLNFLNLFFHLLTQTKPKNNKKGWTPLHTASYHGNLDIILALLESEFFSATSLSFSLQLPLHLFLRHKWDKPEMKSGFLKCLGFFFLLHLLSTPFLTFFPQDLFLNMGVCVNFQDRKGDSLLHCASAAGSLVAVKALLSKEVFSSS